MSINVKAVMDAWDWVSYKAGQDGEPHWYQDAWAQRWKEHQAGAIVPGLTSVGAAERYSFCGTTYCLAGYLAREHVAHQGDGEGELIMGSRVTNHEGDILTVNAAVGWTQIGAFILGITLPEANLLFTGSNTKEDIRRIFNDLLETYGEEVRL